MHHLTVKSNLVDANSMPMQSSKLGFSGEENPVCPKPRRVGVLPEFLKLPPPCFKHSEDKPNAEERSEVLTMIASKIEIEDRRESVGCARCCSPMFYYSGSPPTRTDNALVHDIQFLHQMEIVSPFMRSKISDHRIGFTSASPI